MGEFGWAYVKGALTASGPTGSLQFRDDQAADGTTGLTGSAALVFFTGSDHNDLDGPYELRLKGTLNVQGETWLSGNLHVLGTTTTISSSNLIISDPVIGLGFGTASAHTGAAGDRGFIFGIKDDNNQAMFWDNSSGSFVIGKVGEQAPSKEPNQGQGANYDVPGGDFGVLKVGGILASGTIGESNSGFIFAEGGITSSANFHATGSFKTLIGSHSGSRGIFTGGLTSSADILASGSIKTDVGTISGSRGIFTGGLTSSANIVASGTIQTELGTISGSIGIFTSGLTSSAEILASGNIRTDLGYLSGGLGYFTKQVNMADNLRVSGTAFLGHGQGVAAMAPAVKLHHNVTGALWVTSSHCSKFSGSLSSSIELFGWQIRTSGDLIASGAVSGGIGYFNKQVNMADNLRLSGTAFLGHGQGTTGMAPAVLLHHNVTGALWVTSSHATRLSGAVAITHMHPGTNTLDIAGGNTTTNVVNIAADDCLTTGKVIFIDHNHGASADATPVGISYDFDKDAAAADGVASVFTAIDIDMNDAAANHANSEVTMKGIDIAIESTNVQGTITNIGIDISGSKADTNIGIRTTMDDAAGSPDIVMSSSLNNNDYGVIYVGANGEMTLSTVDQDAANANIVLDPDGKVSVSSNIEVYGTTTLGDASGDSLTINGATVNIPNVAAGTDNTVVIYNGSTLLTDEIDSRVWGSSLVDGEGAATEVARWTDANTVEGDAFLTMLSVSADENYLRVVGEFSASTIRAEKDIMASGSLSGGVGYFNEQVNMADNLRVSGTAFLGHGQGVAAMAPATKLHHNVTGALWVTSSHASIFSGGLHVGYGDPNFTAGYVNPAGAILGVSGSSVSGVPTLSVTHLDIDKTAIHLSSSNTTKPVVDVIGHDVTAGALMALSASSLTTGKVIEIDLNSVGTTGVAPVGVKIDYDRSGDMGNGQTANYVAHKVEMTDASDDHHNGSNVYMVGMDVDVDSAGATVGGAGTNINIGLDIKCTDAAQNWGIRTITDDDIASVDLLMVSDGDNLDYAALSCGANGVLNVVTSGSNTDRTADMTFIADGRISGSAAHGTTTFNIQSTGSNFEGGGIGVHVVGGKIATGSLGVNSHYDPTSLKVSTGGGDVVRFGGDTANTMAADRLVYLNTSGEWIGADADAVGSSGGVLLGICLGADPSDGVLLRGFHHISSVEGSFAKGAVCYVSEAIGKVDFTVPSDPGDVVRVLGYGTSVANVIYFNPSNDWIEL